MITLLTNLTGHATPHVNVLLDVVAADLNAFYTDPGELFAEAKRAKRKVGCVQRPASGETWFTYDLALQAQMEAHLIAALASPCTIAVTASSGGATWDKY